MVSYVEVKQYTTLERVAAWLGLKRRAENRYDCPHAENGHRAITFSPDWPNKDGSRGRFKCWACKVEGDLIALTAHIHKTEDKHAAKELLKTFHGYEPAKRGLPEGGLTDLDYAHERVIALGLTPERAAEIGIGFRNRGTTRNALLISIRDSTGKLVGYAQQDKDGRLWLHKSVLQ